ncbi:MAG: archaemetzincin family Zn-dependent metalloprotease [Thermoleophilia bacterium]
MTEGEQSGHHKLLITPFDDLENAGFDVNGLLKHLAREAGAVFGLEAGVGEYLDAPPGAFHRRRGQYRGEDFLDALGGRRRSPRLLMGITGLDIFLPRLNFVFGVADRERGAAVVSLHRLRPEFYGSPPDAGLLLRRALKEVIHEAGHMLGLSHCRRAECIMHFSNAIGDTDSKGPGFCGECRAKLPVPAS